MIRSFEREYQEVERILTTPPKTAYAEKIEAERFAESLVNQEIQNRQADGTTLLRGEPSPDIRTGVLGQIARRPAPFGVPRRTIEYPKYISKKPGKSWEKKQQLREGKSNFVDRFFLWINAFFK